MTLFEYLRSRGLAARTARDYELRGGRYEAWLAEERGVSLAEAGYTDLLAYVEAIRAAGASRATANAVLRAVGYACSWRELPDPSYGVRVRGVRQAGEPRLLGRDDLEAVARGYRAAPAGPRVRARSYAPLVAELVVGLACRQALERGDVERLAAEDVDVEAGVIRCPGGRQRLPRTLALTGRQASAWRRYLAAGGGRAEVAAAVARIRADRGIGEAVGAGELIPSVGAGEGRLESALRWIGRDVRRWAHEELGVAVRSLRQLRQSRIAAWVDQFGLRRAQVLAGMATVEGVERRYDRAGFEDLRRQVGLYHPLR